MWNLDYAHIHMCTLSRMDTGCRGDGEQETLMGRKKKCCIHCYVKVFVIYMAQEQRREGGFQKEG